MKDQQQLHNSLTPDTVQYFVKVNSRYFPRPRAFMILSLGMLKMDSLAQFDKPDRTDDRMC